MTDYDNRQDKAKRDGGNLGERKAREYCQRRGIFVERFGFDELGKDKGSPFWHLHPELRAAPDYVIFSPASGQWSWLEAKCFARHNNHGFRLHAKKIPLYERWESWYPLLLFVHDIDRECDYIIRLGDLTKYIADNDLPPTGYYDQRTMGRRKPYYEFFEDILLRFDLSAAYPE